MNLSKIESILRGYIKKKKKLSLRNVRTIIVTRIVCKRYRLMTCMNRMHENERRCNSDYCE